MAHPPSPTPQAGAPVPSRKGLLPAGFARAWDKALRNPSAMIIVNTGAQSVLRLVSNVILARLLAPSAFGLMAIVAMIMTGIQMVSDVGIAITALREGEMSRDDEDRLWTMQFVRGIGVALLMVAAAVPVGWIYGDMRLRDVTVALALMPFLQGAQSLYPVLALGHRRLLPSTLLEIGGRVGGMVLSILVAFLTPTVWALVVGSLVGLVVSTVGSHVMAGRRPRFVYDFGYIRRQWKFSRWVQASSTLTFVSGQVDKAVFPFLFGLAPLGVYGIGTTFAVMPSQVTQRWSGSVFYPLTVQLLKGDERARGRLFHVRLTMLLYSSLMVLTVAGLAPAFFTLLYEPRYHQAIVFAQIIALAVYFEVSESTLRHMPLVTGVPQFEVWTGLVRVAAFAIGVVAIHLTGAGVVAYAAAFVLGLLASYVFMLVTCVRYGFLRPRTDILLTTGLIAAVLAIRALPLPRSSTVQLIVEGVVVGSLAVLAVLAVYLRRGLPSISAEPAPETLREVAEEELGTAVTPAYQAQA